MGANRLANETSPYLLQHAGNPVHWQPWDETALALARDTARPILLSIGYTACHWCHVMEHESFEDEATAAFMNEHFVCIKVDREERPDLDKVYQIAHQILSQRPGGWPLTIVMDPVHHVPFFAGTYFPDRPRHGMPSFRDVLKRVAEFYRNNRDDRLTGHVSAMKDAMARLQISEPGDADPALLDQASRELESACDTVNGGFGAAPKFPHPTNISLCLRLWHRTAKQGRPRTALRDIAEHALEAMSTRGLFDHIGGGFYRYSVDARWEIPHFEKMLYDNAQLLPLYADAWLATGSERFREVALQTGRWVMAEMQSPEGGYYSTLDADTEGEEGRFYLWTRDELTSLLDEHEWAVVESRFGLQGGGNFEGKWHLNIHNDLTIVAEHGGVELETVESLLDSARAKLYEARNRRVRPLRDEKILTSWNGLMIRGMAHAGMQLAEPAFTESAQRAVEFIHRTLWRDGRLWATTRDGATRLNAYLDDYVFLIDALLTLNQCDWNTGRMHWAIELADFVLEHFEDPSTGGMFFTSNDHETLLHRDKPGTDDALPAGNGIAARVLLRLGHLVADARYLRAAERVLEVMSGMMGRYPSAHGALMEALCEHLEPPETIVIRGRPGAMAEWRSRCAGYHPDRLVFAIPEQTPGPLPGIIDSMTNRGDTTAYLCRGTACSEPITDPSTFNLRVSGP
ncbi:MAG: thioredoxin domain-containing protein [Gammaproteobacteria bacterium]|nr:thioredoxin domain-containing protein [Gammaproteobacteria bacterium]